MSPHHQSTPARLTAPATEKLPRIILFLLVLAGALPPGLLEADVINGLALLAVLVNASYGGWVPKLVSRRQQQR